MQLQVYFIFLLVPTIILSDTSRDQFVKFKEQHGKVYRSVAEQEDRYNIFRAALKRVEEHNQSGASWKMEINEFSDLTDAEFKSHYLGGYKPLPHHTITKHQSLSQPR